jgi:hypothetical protein
VFDNSKLPPNTLIYPFPRVFDEILEAKMKKSLSFLFLFGKPP